MKCWEHVARLQKNLIFWKWLLGITYCVVFYRQKVPRWKKMEELNWRNFLYTLQNATFFSFDMRICSVTSQFTIPTSHNKWYKWKQTLPSANTGSLSFYLWRLTWLFVCTHAGCKAQCYHWPHTRCPASTPASVPLCCLCINSHWHICVYMSCQDPAAELRQCAASAF